MKLSNVKGFTLFELMLGLVIFTVVATITMTWFNAKKEATAFEIRVADEVRELRQFAEAAEAYAKINKASWAANTSIFVNFSQLAATSPPLLQAGFANRAGENGRTPLHEKYQAIFRKDNSGVVRIVVADYGNVPPAESQTNAIGQPHTAAGVEPFKMKVAAKYSSEGDGGYAGVMSAGQLIVKSPTGSFSQNVSAYWNNTNQLWPVTAVLVGWPEYSGGDGEDGDFSGTCMVLSGTLQSGNYRAPVCPNGYTKHDQWRACYETGMAFRATPIGTALSYARETTERNGGMCNNQCASNAVPPSPCDDLQTRREDEIYILNGVRIANTQCSQLIDTNDVNGSGTFNGCPAGQLVSPKIEDAAAAIGQHHESILCCIEN